MPTPLSCSACKLYTQFPENSLRQFNISAGRSSIMHVNCAKAIFNIPVPQRINTQSLTHQDCRACTLLENRQLETIETNIKNPLLVFTLIGKMPINQAYSFAHQTPESIALGKTKPEVVTAISNGVLHASCAREIFNLGPTLKFNLLANHYESQNNSTEPSSSNQTFTQITKKDQPEVKIECSEKDDNLSFEIDDWLESSAYTQSV